MARIGYKAAADGCLTMDYDGATAAIPTEFPDKTSLPGQNQRSAD